MNLSESVIKGIEPGYYLWAVLLCEKKETGFGSFVTVMNHPPVEGRSVEFYGTPMGGDIIGTIFKVHEVIRFAKCEVPKELEHDFGFSCFAFEGRFALPSIIEYQVYLDIKEYLK